MPQYELFTAVIRKDFERGNYPNDFYPTVHEAREVAQELMDEYGLDEVLIVKMSHTIDHIMRAKDE